MTDLVVVQLPDDAGDLGAWAVFADSTSFCSSSSAVAFEFARGKKASVWKRLFLLHQRSYFNLDWVQGLLERINLGSVLNL